MNRPSPLMSCFVPERKPITRKAVKTGEQPDEPKHCSSPHGQSPNTDTVELLQIQISPESVEDHLVVRKFFLFLLDNVQQNAVLTQKRVHEVAPQDLASALQIACKSEERAVKEFLACAEARYATFLSVSLYYLYENGRNSAQSSLIIPPWDVALVWHAHLLSSFSYHADLASWDELHILRDGGFNFPLSKLASMIRCGIWSHSESEAYWNGNLPQIVDEKDISSYQIWSDHPFRGGIYRLTPPDSFFCQYCHEPFEFTLESYFSYRLDGVTMHCSNCAGFALDMHGRNRLLNDLTAILASPNGDSIVAFQFEALTGLKWSESLVSSLGGGNLQCTPFWSALQNRNAQWPKILEEARRTQSYAISRVLSTGLLEKLCLSYLNIVNTWSTIDLVETSFGQAEKAREASDEGSFSILHSLRTSRTNYEEYETYLNRQSVTPTLISPSREVEILWTTHLLDHFQYYEWCVKRFGLKVDHYPFSKASVESRVARGSGLASCPSGVISQAQNPRADAPISFSIAESNEALRLLRVPGAKKVVLEAIVAEELLERIPTSSTPCTMSLLRQVCQRQVAAAPRLLQHARAVMAVFPMLRKIPSVDAWIKSALESYTQENQGLTSLEQVVPDENWTELYRHLLIKRIDGRPGSSHQDDKCFNRMRILFASDLPECPFDVDKWNEELLQRYPRLYAEFTDRLDVGIEAYIPDVRRSLIDEEEGRLQLAEVELLRLEEAERERQEEIDRQLRESKSTCAVCWDELQRADFPTGKITESCNHTLDVCSSCLSQAIAAQLDLKAWNTLTCPIPACASPLQDHDVYKYAASETIERYERYMINDSQKDDPCFRRCQRGTCPGGQVHVGGAERPLMTCDFCGFEMCFVHGIPWHEGQWCSEYDESIAAARRKKEDLASDGFIDTIAKRCPRAGCGAAIVKNKGCDHMTCLFCKQQFCWLCLANYVPGMRSSRHNVGCRYRPANVPVGAMLDPGRHFPNR